MSKIEKFISFIKASPTSWHAAHTIATHLEEGGFIPLKEEDKWSLEKGKSYFVQREGSVAAFTLPKEAPTALRAVASHTDSPALKLKPKPEKRVKNMTLLTTEVYGGPMINAYLNRDLAIAGRVVCLNAEGKVEEKLLFADDTPVTIPQLAIHIDREVNDKGLHLNKHDHLRALVGINLPENESFLEKLIHRHVPCMKILSSDLFLVPIEAPKTFGFEKKLLASYRIDNLSSAYAALQALLEKKESAHLPIAFFYDHEEVGSATLAGAASTLFDETLIRIQKVYGWDEEDLFRLKRNSFLASVDVGHGFNPNYEKKFDDNHPLLLGAGIAIKFQALQRYASDARSAGMAISLCDEKKIPYQLGAGRSDIPCGSTVGPILSHKLGISTVDLGICQLSMHATREIMATEDLTHLTNFLTHFMQEK